jgi:hypothetical protein
MLGVSLTRQNSTSEEGEHLAEKRDHENGGRAPLTYLLYEEVNTMRTDIYSLEWEMNHRVTSAHDQKQRDRLERLCLEAQEAELARRGKRDDLGAGKLVGLANQLWAAVSQVLRPVWGDSLEKAGKRS